MAEDGGRQLVSKSEYARHRGVTPAMVTRWTQAARIVIVEKRVDLAASDALLAQTLDPARGGKNGKSNGHHGRPKDRPGAESGTVPGVEALPVATDAYTKVRTQREGFRAKTEEIEYRQRIGELVERKAYDKALADGMAPILSALDSMSARLGPGLAAEADVRKVQNMIDDAITDIRQDVATTLRRMIDGGGGTRQ